MRILGIDLGDKNIGLAISDKLLITAQALGRYCGVNQKEDIKYFKKLVATYDIGEIVVGLPLRMNGSSGTQAKKAIKFAKLLEKTLNLPIILWDERLSTKHALQILRNQKIKGKAQRNLKDQISATLILSSYLESRKLNPHGS